MFKANKYTKWLCEESVTLIKGHNKSLNNVIDKLKRIYDKKEKQEEGYGIGEYVDENAEIENLCRNLTPDEYKELGKRLIILKIQLKIYIQD